ncbi:MAG: hypothetical protein BGO26_19455 [Actinobacteria bacterium 69-20]|nr:MAG: hypothetical protein BGO26_19455 [Actinobacteria bacterium 69-20]
MQVYISVDMEGIAGIAIMDQVVRGGHGYPRAQQLMTAETNAAISGTVPPRRCGRPVPCDRWRFPSGCTSP